MSVDNSWQFIDFPAKWPGFLCKLPFENFSYRLLDLRTFLCHLSIDRISLKFDAVHGWLEPLIFSTSTLGMGLLIEAGPEGAKYCECGTKVILILLE
jgi:hypothetical protein